MFWTNLYCTSTDCKVFFVCLYWSALAKCIGKIYQCVFCLLWRKKSVIEILVQVTQCPIIDKTHFFHPKEVILTIDWENYVHFWILTGIAWLILVDKIEEKQINLLTQSLIFCGERAHWPFPSNDSVIQWLIQWLKINKKTFVTSGHIDHFLAKLSWIFLSLFFPLLVK